MAGATGMAFAYHTINKSELQGHCREDKRAGLGEGDRHVASGDGPIPHPPASAGVIL